MTGPGDFCKVTYRGIQRRLPDGGEYFDEQTPLRLMWDSKPYVVRPGETAFALYEAVMVAAGDSRSTDITRTVRDEAGNVSWVVDRPTEVRRLRTLYDNHGEFDEIRYAPQMEVEDLEGNRITTVLDDPEGQGVVPVQTTLLDREQLLAQVQRQQRMIEQLANAQGVDLDTASSVVAPSSQSDPAATTTEDTDPFASLPEG